MKQLQNNFTTPEQSKRLLQLGVPADSANYARFQDDFYPEVLHSKYSEYMEKLIFTEPEEYTPCWSVDRLIEIMKICSIPVMTWYIKSDSKQSLIELFMEHLETSILERDIDFSKLED